jgi:hypothetical protein
MNQLHPEVFKALNIKTPRFCVIAPTEYLSLFAPKSTAHLVLAHIVEDDASYAAFYRSMRERGDLIIMDNGAFELGESYDPQKLVVLGKQCGAEYLVLPDYPFQDGAKTIEAAKEFAPQFLRAGFKSMFVPQSIRGDMEQWIRAYTWAASNPAIDIIGMSILGIPGALPHIPPAYARVVMTQILIDRKLFAYHKHHHYLGLNAGPGLEVPALISMNALDTCDSSAPVWQGLLGVEYTKNADSLSPVKKIHFPVQFDYPMTRDKATLMRIDKNVNMTLDLFSVHC